MMRTHLRDELELLERIGALTPDELDAANARGHAGQLHPPLADVEREAYARGARGRRRVVLVVAVDGVAHRIADVRRLLLHVFDSVAGNVGCVVGERLRLVHRSVSGVLGAA